MPDVIGAVVLAAGSATRFGGGKLAATFRGTRLLLHPLALVASAQRGGTLADAVVVHRPEDQWIAEAAIASRLRPISNAAPDHGLSASIQLGLEALATTPCAWAMIVLGDQPLLRADVIASLVQAATTAGPDVDLIRPRYAEEPDVPGHPALLHRRAWAAARALPGDRGPGTLVPAERTREIPVSGRNPDVDVPDDLARLERR